MWGQITPAGVFMLRSAQGPGKPGMCAVCAGAMVHLFVQALCVYIYDRNMHDALLMVLYWPTDTGVNLCTGMHPHANGLGCEGS